MPAPTGGGTHPITPLPAKRIPAQIRSLCRAYTGEALLLGVDGRSDFNGLHSRKNDDEVQLYAFDCLVNNGNDLRKLP